MYNTHQQKEFEEIIDKTGVEVNKLFNTHGAKYKELGLKDKLKDLSTDEKLNLLASDGMLVKRPLAIAGDNITLDLKKINTKKFGYSLKLQILII